MRKKARTKGDWVKRDPGPESINKNKPKLERLAVGRNKSYIHAYIHTLKRMFDV